MRAGKAKAVLKVGCTFLSYLTASIQQVHKKGGKASAHALHSTSIDGGGLIEGRPKWVKNHEHTLLMVVGTTAIVVSAGVLWGVFRGSSRRGGRAGGAPGDQVPPPPSSDAGVAAVERDEDDPVPDHGPTLSSAAVENDPVPDHGPTLSSAAVEDHPLPDHNPTSPSAAAEDVVALLGGPTVSSVTPAATTPTNPPAAGFDGAFGGHDATSPAQADAQAVHKYEYRLPASVPGVQSWFKTQVGELSGRFGVSVTIAHKEVSSEAGDSWRWVVTITSSDKMKAQQAWRHLKAPQILHLNVDSQSVGQLVGKGSSRVKQLMEQEGAYVRVSGMRFNGGKQEALIFGYDGNAQRVKEILQQRIKSLSERQAGPAGRQPPAAGASTKTSRSHHHRSNKINKPKARSPPRRARSSPPPPPQPPISPNNGPQSPTHGPDSAEWWGRGKGISQRQW